MIAIQCKIELGDSTATVVYQCPHCNYHVEECVNLKKDNKDIPEKIICEYCGYDSENPQEEHYNIQRRLEYIDTNPITDKHTYYTGDYFYNYKTKEYERVLNS